MGLEFSKIASSTKLTLDDAKLFLFCLGPDWRLPTANECIENKSTFSWSDTGLCAWDRMYNFWTSTVHEYDGNMVTFGLHGTWILTNNTQEFMHISRSTISESNYVFGVRSI